MGGGRDGGEFLFRRDTFQHFLERFVLLLDYGALPLFRLAGCSGISEDETVPDLTENQGKDERHSDLIASYSQKECQTVLPLVPVISRPGLKKEPR